MSAQDTIGKRIDATEGRDAIHIAMAPVVADCKLYPGQDVGFAKAGDPTRVTCLCEKFVGIIDPFLKGAVFSDQRCWLLLYPNTISSLRHVCEHPAFADKAEPDLKPLVDRSRQWMTDWAGGHGMTADAMIQAGRDYIEDGEYLCHGRDFQDCVVPEEFWRHYEILTGEKVSYKTGSFFSCSC